MLNITKLKKGQVNVVHSTSVVDGINFRILALCQMMLVKRNLRIIWTEQKEENLFLFCLFG